MRIEAAHVMKDAARRTGRTGLPLTAKPTPDLRICPSCRGRTVDRYGFDCTTCFGEGTVNE
jgi:hypothetical protein